VPRRASLRASDADREAVAERLRQATIEGRLLAEELEQRLEVLFCARTYGELDGLVADLPIRHAPPRRRQATIGHYVIPAIAIAIVLPLVVAVVVAAVAFLLTGVFAVWVVWLAIGWWFFGHRGRGLPPRRRIHWTRF
jgi:uncharacterized membrane protein YdbT with pleckstrin-like domain